MTPLLARATAAARRLRLRLDGPLTGRPGARAAGVPGVGTSFAGYRDYQHGDDVRLIDWNVFARHGRPSVKVFEHDRAAQFYFIVDGSASMRDADPDKWATTIETTALLTTLAASTGDRVGYALVTDRVEHSFAPQAGERRARTAITTLDTWRPSSPGTDLTTAIGHTIRVLRRPGSVVILSDGLDRRHAVPAWIQQLTQLRRHAVVVLVVSSPLEAALPDVGLLQVRDAETGDTCWLDTHAPLVRRTFTADAARRRRHVLRAIRKAGASAIEVWTGQPLLPQLSMLVGTRR